MRITAQILLAILAVAIAAPHVWAGPRPSGKVSLYFATSLSGDVPGTLDHLTYIGDGNINHADGVPNPYDLADGDICIVASLSGVLSDFSPWVFDADGTDANGPKVVRPADFTTAGIWRLSEVPIEMLPAIIVRNPMTVQHDIIAAGAGGTPVRVAAVSGALAGWNDAGVFGAITQHAHDDSGYHIMDDLDGTKRVRFDAGDIGTGQTRVVNTIDGDMRMPAAGAVSAAGVPQQTTARPGGLQEPLIATFKPQTVWDNNTSRILVLHPNTPAAYTVTRIYGSALADPATELDMDLMYADACIGLAGATVVDAIDSLAGVVNETAITSAAIGSGKCIYIRINTDPDDAIAQFSIAVEGDWD